MIYFFDKGSVRESYQFELVPGPMEKLGPVLEPLSNEGAHAGDFAGSIVDLNDGRYRMYYTRYGKAGLRIAVTESSEGLHWERPAYDFNKQSDAGANEISVEGLPADTRDYYQAQVFQLDDDHRRMYFWAHGSYFRYVRAESRDGITWKVVDFDQPALYHTSELYHVSVLQDKALEHVVKALQSNDATHIYKNPLSAHYEMYTVWLLPNPRGSERHIEIDNAPGVLRSIQRRTSKDGLNFANPELIIVPDAEDPLDLQFYYLSVHEQDGWRFGFLGRYLCAQQTMDIELCFSRDGINWDRTLRYPWLTRGKGNDIDSAMAIAPSRLLDAGDHWLMLYQGTNRLHNWWAAPQPDDGGRMVVCAAKFAKRRFAGLSAKGKSLLWTKPFIPSGNTLFLDGNVKGQLTAELCDAFGKSLPGYEKCSFDSISGDCTRHVMKWRGHSLDEHTYNAVSLRLEIVDGDIYALYWG